MKRCLWAAALVAVPGFVVGQQLEVGDTVHVGDLGGSRLVMTLVERPRAVVIGHGFGWELDVLMEAEGFQPVNVPYAIECSRPPRIGDVDTDTIWTIASDTTNMWHRQIRRLCDTAGSEERWREVVAEPRSQVDMNRSRRVDANTVEVWQRVYAEPRDTPRQYTLSWRRYRCNDYQQVLLGSWNYDGQGRVIGQGFTAEGAERENWQPALPDTQGETLLEATCAVFPGGRR